MLKSHHGVHLRVPGGDPWPSRTRKSKCMRAGAVPAADAKGVYDCRMGIDRSICRGRHSGNGLRVDSAAPAHGEDSGIWGVHDQDRELAEKTPSTLGPAIRE